MAKRIQPKLSRPKKEIVQDACWAAAINKAGTLLSALMMVDQGGESPKGYGPDYYQGRAAEHALSIRDYLGAAEGVWSAEGVIKTAVAIEERYGPYRDAALALVTGAAA